jgi:predicted dienelactone hydrolase
MTIKLRLSRACTRILLPVLLSAILSTTAAAELYKVERGSYAIQTTTGVWYDRARNDRSVMWKLFYPEDMPTPAPVIVWSHGGGGTRDGNVMLATHLASWGYAALHLQHQGSDLAAMRADRRSVFAQVNDPKLSADRFQDVAFAVKQLDGFNARGLLKAGIDTSRIGISGHSFGAINVLVAAGQRIPGFGDSYAVPSFKAAFAMSPSPPRQLFAADDNFVRMRMPIFHLTGTDDESPAGDFQPVDRQAPFRRIANVHQYLLVLKAANHMTFTGARRPFVFGRDWSYPSLARHHQILRSLAVAFWDSELKGDWGATRWLREGAAAAEIGQEGNLQFKPRT